MNVALKLGVLTSASLFAVGCGDDSGSSTSPVNPASSGSVATCDLSAYATLPMWTGAYFIYADGSVTDGTNAVGTFDFATGNILDATGATIATLDVSALPYFDGQNLIYKNCAVMALDGSTVGRVDENGTVVDGNVETSSSSTEIPTDPTSSATIDVNPLSSATLPLSSSGTSGETPVASSSSAKTSGSGTMDASGYEVMNYANILNNNQTGWSSRYWDACKPHCSWPGNVDTSSLAAYQANYGAARNCNINDYEIPAWTLSYNVQQYWKGYQGTTSACTSDRGGGTGGAFTCTDMAPIAVNDTLSYAFVAAPGSGNQGCGKCYHLQFNGGNHDNDVKAAHKALKGKHMVVMASNIGNDVEQGQFDMMVPGGGVGQYDALSSMIGVSKDELGVTSGGFLSTCQQTLGYDAAVAKYQSCIIEKCEAVFPNHANLLRGCKWFAEWYMAADNPTYNWEEVECPQYLIDKYKTTINTVIETNIAWQDDWSSYTGGTFETKDCDDKGCP